MEETIRTLTERQRGVVTRRQLQALGLSEAGIRWRLERGWLIRLHPSVYTLGNRILAPRGHLLAAVLAGGPEALLSHKSAGSVWGLLASTQASVDVTIPGTSRDPYPGIRRHRTRRLHPEDISANDGIPVTSVARTILDLAGVLRPQQLLEVIEQADRLEILDFAALRRAIDRRPNVRGVAHLGHIIREYAGVPDTKSQLERDFLALITEVGLPRPLLNTKVAGLTVDVYWPQWGLVVELDSRAYHLNPRQFEADRIRDAKIQRLDLRGLRVTNRRMRTAAGEVIEDIYALAALAA